MVSVVCLVTTSPFTYSDCFSDSSTPRPCPNSLIPFSVSRVLLAACSYCQPLCPLPWGEGGQDELCWTSICPSHRRPHVPPFPTFFRSHFWLLLLFLMLCCCHRLDSVLSEVFSNLSDAVDTSKTRRDCQGFILFFLLRHRVPWIPLGLSLNQQLSLCMLSFTKNSSQTVCWVMNKLCYPIPWGLHET